MPLTPASHRLRSALFRALRAGFRAIPMPDSARDVLRQRFLAQFPTIRPLTPQGQIVAGLERRPRTHSAERAIGYVERRDEPLPDPLPATLVAFYLPQFHAIAENDAWWGRGFTEWSNVTRALPQFEGHVQPRLPGELGFYDLRNRQVMRDQAELAREYGIGAFCFYFYWFGGHTLLEAPLRQWLSDTSIDLKFCLCWANENWTRRWDGRDSETLIAQTHSAEDDLAFISHIAPYLRDPRYLRVDGRPLLLVYRPTLLPDPRTTSKRWRGWCRDNGIGEIELAYVQSFERPDPGSLGFDCAVEFPPNLAAADDITRAQRLLNPEYRGEVLDWRALPAAFACRPPTRYRLVPGVNCGWDNEPRRAGAGRSFVHAAPRRYRDWLHTTITNRMPAQGDGSGMVFINAWNEWAEGAVLEPDSRLGYAWLQATRSALVAASTAGRPRARHASRACVVIHAWYMPEFAEILTAIHRSELAIRLVVTTVHEKLSTVREELSRSGLSAEIHTFENRGRDVLPFLHVANLLIDQGEEVVLKLHTKRSPHRSDGDRWRRELLSRLLSTEDAHRIPNLFAADPGLGMLAPQGHIQPLAFYWGANKANVERLCARIGIRAPDPASDVFVSGSMFWARLEGLRPLLDAHLDTWEFEPENAQVDGTMAHAVERIFTMSVLASGLRLAASEDPARSAASHTPGSTYYPYARRD